MRGGSRCRERPGPRPAWLSLIRGARSPACPAPRDPALPRDRTACARGAEAAPGSGAAARSPSTCGHAAPRRSGSLDSESERTYKTDETGRREARPGPARTGVGKGRKGADPNALTRRPRPATPAASSASPSTALSCGHAPCVRAADPYVPALAPGTPLAGLPAALRLRPAS